MSASERLSGIDEIPRLLDLLLSEQQSLSAVETFAQRHDAGALIAGAASYEDLIPVGRTPGAGQQLAFRVDLDACTGCKACVTACHNLNGLAPDETWRAVGLVVGGDVSDVRGTTLPVQQTVTTTCHHCEDPACLSGCPVRAYEKDPITGIVRHLDDQCIGCQYCTLTCPYEVPQYRAELGIVRKCDMCTGRLAVGEAPACVQGCPNDAISIEIVDQVGPEGARELLPGLDGMLPDSRRTRPTTRYVSERPITALRPADLERVSPAAPHDPLAVMLVLMQLSVGVLLCDVVWTALGAAGAGASPLRLALAAAAAVAGLGAATLHLGRPLYAFRAFLGWRTSWMSREILVMGGYVGALTAAAAASALAQVEALAALAPAFVVETAGALAPGLAAAALALGVAGSVCSVMIYVDTGRGTWTLARTTALFVGSLVVLGAVGAGAASAVAPLVGDAALAPGVGALLAAGLVATLAKLVGEAHAWSAPESASHARRRSARLLVGALRGRVRARRAAAGLGGAFGALALGAAWLGAPLVCTSAAVVALAALVVGEGLERHLFFVAEVSPAMPGA